MPKPQQDETREDFVSRYVSEVIDEEGLPQEEALGQCFGIWDSEKDGKSMNKPNGAPSEHKKISFDSFQVKQSDVIVDGEEMQVATFEGVANVMEHKDRGGDIIHKGAFKKSLEEKEGKVPFVTDHTYKIDNFVGIAYLEEQGDLLKAKVEVLLSNNPAGKSFLSKAKFANHRGEPLGLSIGYDIPKGKYEMKDGTRHIYEIKLYEVSGVLFPMNELSRAVGFKGMGFEELEEQKKLIEKILEAKGHSLGSFLNQAVNDMAADDEMIKEIIGDLAERTGMNRDRVAEVLNGDMIRPSDQVLEGFAEVLNVPYEQLRTLADNDIGKGMQSKQMEAFSPDEAEDQESFMGSCTRVLNHMQVGDSDEERSQLCLAAWQEDDPEMAGMHEDEDEKSIQELITELKKLKEH